MKKKVIFLLFVSIWLGCSTNKPQTNNETKNKSHYHIQRYNKIQDADSAIVIGQIYNMTGNNIKCFYINIDSKKLYSECKNKITFTLTPNTYQFTGHMVGYDSVKTNKFFISAGDSLHINFYLEQEISLHKK